MTRGEDWPSVNKFAKRKRNTKKGHSGLLTWKEVQVVGRVDNMEKEKLPRSIYSRGLYHPCAARVKPIS